LVCSAEVNLSGCHPRCCVLHLLVMQVRVRGGSGDVIADVGTFHSPVDRDAMYGPCLLNMPYEGIIFDVWISLAQAGEKLCSLLQFGVGSNG